MMSQICEQHDVIFFSINKNDEIITKIYHIYMIIDINLLFDANGFLIGKDKIEYLINSECVIDLSNLFSHILYRCKSDNDINILYDYISRYNNVKIDLADTMIPIQNTEKLIKLFIQNHNDIYNINQLIYHLLYLDNIDMIKLLLDNYYIDYNYNEYTNNNKFYFSICEMICIFDAVNCFKYIINSNIHKYLLCDLEKIVTIIYFLNRSKAHKKYNILLYIIQYLNDNKLYLSNINLIKTIIFNITYDDDKASEQIAHLTKLKLDREFKCILNNFIQNISYSYKIDQTENIKFSDYIKDILIGIITIIIIIIINNINYNHQ